MSVLNLYQKVSSFEASLPNEHKVLSQCKSGCARCCYADLSVFEVEAQNIRNWFSILPQNEKSLLREKWSVPQKEALTFQNEQQKSCVFLHDEKCSIYEARPLICRTQGLPLKFKDNNDVYIDICPLNDSILQVSEEPDVLNLELVNLILSQIETVDAKGIARDRIKLVDLRNELLSESD